MATSRVALGKVRVALNKGEELPGDWLINHKGQPSRDPSVMEAHIYHRSGKDNPAGALTPAGDYKGYGLALFCELLGGMLSGGFTIQPEHDRKGGITNNMTTFIVDPSRLLEMPAMHHEIEAMVNYVKASPPAKSKNPILIAGDPERNSLREREENGIPVDDNTWKQILDSGENLKIERGRLLEISGI